MKYLDNKHNSIQMRKQKKAVNKKLSSGYSYKRPAVFLDRDGVINRAVVKNGKPHPPNLVSDFQFLPGVREATESLSSKGFKLIIVTNQPDVSTGAQKLEVIELMHNLILETIHIDSIRVCYHVDMDNCLCRKPKPGMLLDAMKEFSLDLPNSYMVGDRWRDIEAGNKANCKTILLDSAYQEKKAENPWGVVSSLLEASNLILSEPTIRG